MWRIFEFCWTLLSLTLVGGIYLTNIRDDYCELYLNASNNTEKSCNGNDSYVITNEYELRFFDSGRLVLNWTATNFFGWNIVAIRNSNKMEKGIFFLKIVGNWSLEDSRLRPASFYLNKLNVKFAVKFQIDAEDFVITEKNCHYKMGPLTLWIEFKRSVYVGPIHDYINASTKRIEELSIIGIPALDSDLCDHFKFFSLPELQENVIKLHLVGNMTVKMKCFENYGRLTHIRFKGPYEPFENLTALICPEWGKCLFTVGINGIRCPTDCECSHLYFFKVSCSPKNKLTQIPPLPIPSDYKIKLYFSLNELSQLPNNTLPGYIEVVSLDVSKNKITSLAIDKLPMNLISLDISDNPIKTIDIEVADFLSNVNYVTQEGIRWIANCDEKYLFRFFQTIPAWQNISFGQLNGTCPKKCMCCFDRTTNNFLINCTNRAVKYPELPSHIPNNVALLLANCGIRKLPSNLFLLLKTQNVAHLDLRNNRLRSLDDKSVLFLYENGNTTIELSGNPLHCHCKTRSFLGFLKNRKPSEYTTALARCKISMCPDSCVCCLVALNSSALSVDCRGQRLTRFPLLPSSVTSLDLGNNDITEINLQSQEFLMNVILFAELKLLLSGNPWTCTCDKNNLVAFAKSISQQIPDFAGMECSNLGKRLALVEDSEICPSFFIYPLLLFVFSLIIITALNAFVYFKQPILMWFYEHEIFMSMAVRLDLEHMKKFDAFLCFTHKDEHLIEEYVERLENGQQKFRLCFYLRDWNIGASIPECIIQVNDSRRVIILMTKNFLESTWGKLEFRLALHATSQDRCKRLIVILYPDVENFDDLDSELKAYMVLNTYLRRDSPNFWNKLIYSMPHIT